jgi:hypothetical protein
MFGPELSADPYPTYRKLREQDPVHLCPDGTWFLTPGARERLESTEKEQWSCYARSGTVFGGICRVRRIDPIAAVDNYGRSFGTFYKHCLITFDLTSVAAR